MLKEEIFKFIEDFKNISYNQICMEFGDVNKIIDELINERKIFKKDIDGLILLTIEKETKNEEPLEILEPSAISEKIKEKSDVLHF